MLDKLQATKKIIDPFLIAFLEEQVEKFQDQQLAKKAFAKIKAFAISGKTVRGGLFLLASESLSQSNYLKYQSDFLLIASALELIHSGILMHDDIIDQDEKRRGLDSVWHQYEKEAEQLDYSNPKRYGEGLAICVGSLIHYLADLALSKISSLPTELQKIIKQTIDQEIINTHFAEMLDSKITSQKDNPNIKEVLEMYLFKTARYTFSLPLQLAGIVSSLENEELSKLSQIGEELGLIFQIQDDAIGIFATEEISGKSFASDIREGKKTIFYLHLLEEINDQDETFLAEKYGQPNLSSEEINKIQDLFRQHALPKTKQLLEELAGKASEKIESISSHPTQLLLQETLRFNLNREK